MRRVTRRARLRAGKYLAVARVALATGLTYRGDYLFRASFLVVVMFVFMVLWRTTYDVTGETVIDGFTLRDMIWYLAITETIIASRPRLAGRIDTEVKSGSLAYTLGRPYNYVLFQFAQSAGDIAARAVVNFTVAGGMAALLVGPPPFGLCELGAFVPVLLLALTLDFFLTMPVGLLAFWVEETGPFSFLQDRLLMLLGGMMLPLEVFPPLLRRIAGWLPMSLIVYAPARTLAGERLPFPGQVIAAQVSWLAVGIVVCTLVFRAGVKKVNLHGG
ncbi:MAG: ABC-2 family transporter protein [Bacillota bacterium]|nr:ABC-2 family transporter protein [Bacillota bacterium]